MDHQIDPSDWYFNLNSPLQMQEFLYEFLELKPITEKNDKGNLSVAEPVITHYAENEGVKFCSLLIAYRKLMKAKNTYLADILRNISDEDRRVHPDYWLTTAVTYRSSSSNPNDQNIPKHEQIIEGLQWKEIRKLYTSIPEPSWLMAEVDYEGAETKVAGMLGNDPQMIEDLNNDMDLHSHWAIELFGLHGMSYKEVKDKYDETYRFLAKNNFTFADIFGAMHQSIAKEMRKSEFYKEYVESEYKKCTSKKFGFEKYFIEFSETQVERCQNARKERYPIYTAWQEGIVRDYYKKGYVDNPFGFRRRYPVERNQIINYPIQSTSFLLLLDSLIQIEKQMEKDGFWKSHLIGQVHDSGKANVFKKEAKDFIDMVDDKMINKPHLPWTRKVKMGTDWNFGYNWYEMNRVAKKNNKLVVFNKCKNCNKPYEKGFNAFFNPLNNYSCGCLAN